MSRAARQRASGARRRKRYVREYYKRLMPFRGALVLVFVLALTSVGLSLLLPLATRHVIDKVLPASQLSEEEKLREPPLESRLSLGMSNQSRNVGEACRNASYRT